MSAPILLIDTNYLCHRAFHAMGALTHGDIGVGAVFGVLRDIVSLQEQMGSKTCVFAFDHGGATKRHELFPGYKMSRAVRHDEETDAQKAARLDFYKQVDALRDDYLPSVGFRNVFSEPGFEGDDIIASVASDAPVKQEVIIVSADKDLFQCLRENVWIWNPHKKRGYSYNAFVREWGMLPERWPEVKAYAGDSGDDIPGIKGVGERTAAKFIKNALGKHTETYRRITGIQARRAFIRNMRLVTLPFEGTPSYEIRQDEVTEELWESLADRLGMRSIKGTPPPSATRKSKGRKRGQQKGFGLDS